MSIFLGIIFLIFSFPQADVVSRLVPRIRINQVLFGVLPSRYHHVFFDEQQSLHSTGKCLGGRAVRLLLLVFLVLRLLEWPLKNGRDVVRVDERVSPARLKHRF